MQIPPVRPFHVTTTRAAANGPAAPAPGPARRPSPAKPVRAQGAPDVASKVGGTLLGTAAGVAGAYSIGVLLTIGSASIPVLGWAAIAASVAAGAGLGYLGGDRLGARLEGKAAQGKPHLAAQIGGGALGGVLGLAGGFWLGFWTLGAATGMPLLGLIPGVVAAGVGALGGAEGAKRLVDTLARN